MKPHFLFLWKIKATIFTTLKWNKLEIQIQEKFYLIFYQKKKQRISANSCDYSKKILKKFKIDYNVLSECSDI